MTSGRSNLALGAAFILLTSLGAIQGNRVNGLRDTATFYRWLISASEHSRIDGTLEYYDSARSSPAKDEELFAALLDLADAEMAEAPPIENSERMDGVKFLDRTLVRASAARMDDAIWDFATSDAADELREEFFTHLAAGDLQSVGTQMTMASLYGIGADEVGEEAAYNVGVTNLFFGFRKVAANFLWLQVDTYWHQGNYHRMVPLMKTCVTLDPNFIDAYLLGAWHLAYNISVKVEMTPEPEKVWSERRQRRLGLREEWYYAAADFLKDGIEKNPRDFRLYFDLGYAVYDEKLQDWPNAVRYLREATRYRHETQVARRLYVALMNNGEYEEAIEGWRDYAEKNPQNVVAPRFLKVCEAYLAEAVSKEALGCVAAAQAAADVSARAAKAAREAGEEAGAVAHDKDRAAAEAARDSMMEEAEVQRLTALTIWEDLRSPDGSAQEDVLASGRILHMTALEYLEKGRAREAIQLLIEARWKSAKMTQQVNNLIIDIKLEYDFPLTTSEVMAVERRKDASMFPKVDNRPVIHRLNCSYRDSPA